jgi:gliding motility-associated protein GldM
MGIPKEPRQQMINMMYLFLTAMLALNVSAEILRAFSLVTNTLESSAQSYKSKNESIMRRFEVEYQANPDKNKVYYEKAKLAVKYSGELVQQIKSLKLHLIDQVGNKNGKIDAPDFEKPKEPGVLRVKREDDLDIPSQVMLVSDGGRRGKELKASINETRERLLAIIDGLMEDSDQEAFALNFPLRAAVDKRVDGVRKSWQQTNFGEVPLAAAITLLSKYESDARSAESEVLSVLKNSVIKDDWKFDAINSIVIPNSTYIMQGGEYQADIITAATNTTLDPIVIIGDVDEAGNILSDDTTRIPVVNGIGRLRMDGSTLGNKSYKGVVMLKRENGSYNKFPFSGDWNVMAGQAVVSPTAMNVLYVGLDNPLAISAAGFTADKVKPSCIGCIVHKLRNGEYVARVEGGTEATVRVGVTQQDGTVKQVGTQLFRVKYVPDPVATVGGRYKGGTIPAHIMKVQRGLIADLENFVFKMNFDVVSFEMSYLPKGETILQDKSRSPAFTDKMKRYLNRIKKGDLVFFDDIVVMGPDRKRRKLPGMVFKIN